MNAKVKAYVEAKVRSGEYSSDEAVYKAGIEALQREEQALEELRREIDIGSLMPTLAGSLSLMPSRSVK